MASTVWRGYISFGLISIPARLYRAARAEKISFRRLHRQPAEAQAATDDMDDTEEREAAPLSALRANGNAGPSLLRRPSTADQIPSAANTGGAAAAVEPVLSRVQQVSVRKGTDEVLTPKSVVKGFEYEKDRYVVVEADELKSVAPKTSTSMEIQEFVQLAEIDPVYFETSYYLTPEEAGEKAYALLYRSLQTAGLVAIAQFAMHSREHVVVLRPGKKGLLAHTMFYASEVRADEEFRADTSTLSAKELELAQTLVNSLAAPFDPAKYHDTYREKIQSLIDKKMQGQAVALTAPPPAQTNVVDIADALRRSLAALKKPAASDAQSRGQEGKAESQPAKSRAKRAGRNL